MNCIVFGVFQASGVKETKLRSQSIMIPGGNVGEKSDIPLQSNLLND